MGSSTIPTDIEAFCNPCRMNYGQTHLPHLGGEFVYCPQCGTKLTIRNRQTMKEVTE